MDYRRILGKRLFHMLLLSAFVAVALFPPIRALLPAWDLALAIGILAAWMLGQRYEREMIVDAGLADREDILAEERKSMRWRRSGE